MVAGLVNGDNPLGVMVIGTDPATDEEAASHLVSGQRLSADDEVLLVDNFARSLKLAVGEHRAAASAAGRATSFASWGWSSPAAWPASTAAQWCLCRCPRAARLFKLGDQVTAIPIVLADRADQDAVRDAVASRLPPGLSVRSPAARGELAQHSLFGAEQGLSALERRIDRGWRICHSEFVPDEPGRAAPTTGNPSRHRRHQRTGHVAAGARGVYSRHCGHGERAWPWAM